MTLLSPVTILLKVHLAEISVDILEGNVSVIASTRSISPNVLQKVTSAILNNNSTDPNSLSYSRRTAARKIEKINSEMAPISKYHLQEKISSANSKCMLNFNETTIREC